MYRRRGLVFRKVVLDGASRGVYDFLDEVRGRVVGRCEKDVIPRYAVGSPGPWIERDIVARLES
jgi:hypothetical protein